MERKRRRKWKKDGLSSFKFPGNIVVISTAEEANASIKKYLLNEQTKNIGLGFDMEWKPEVAPDRSPIALIQLCNGRTCLLFQLIRIGSMPDELRRLLTSDQVLKIGCDVSRSDAKRLLEEYQLQLNNTFDILPLACTMGFRQTGLASITRAIFGLKLSKRQQRSHWDHWLLSQQQMTYAATDAYAHLCLYHKLMAIWAQPEMLEEILMQDKLELLKEIQTSTANEEQLVVASQNQQQQQQPQPQPHSLFRQPHRPIPVNFACFRCFSQFDCKYDLIVHCRTEHLNLQCTVCGVHTTSAECLMDHITHFGHHWNVLLPTDESGRHTCPQCKKKYKSLDACEEHYLYLHFLQASPDCIPVPHWLPEVSYVSGRRVLK